MVKKEPALLSTPTTRKNTNHRHYHPNEQQNHYFIQQQAYKEFYQQFTAPQEVFFKLQPIEMANDASSTSGVHGTPVSVLAIPTVTTVTSAVPVTAAGRQTSTSNKSPSSKHSSQPQQPSIHIAPPPPRLALHHLHPLGPIAIQANPNPWPIVEPVFHFGPGFDHQHYCPTHSSGPQPHEYVVFFHVNAGVSVTFQISGNREVIRGK